jgi:hypothetical protein
MTSEEIIRRLKVMTHLAYDICYTKDTFKVLLKDSDVKEFRKFIDALGSLDFMNTTKEETTYMPHQRIYPTEDSEGMKRILETLDLMYTEFNTILELKNIM